METQYDRLVKMSKKKPETFAIVKSNGRTTAKPGTLTTMSGRLYIVNGLGYIVPYTGEDNPQKPVKGKIEE